MANKSGYLESIITNKNRTCNMQVVFVDIVSYSKRRSQTQAIVIDAFMASLKHALEETAKQYIKYSQQNNINFSTDIIVLPSGDGAAVCFPFEGAHDMHLYFAKTLISLVAKINQKNDCAKFKEQKWCNCHDSFNLTIGVSEGKTILYKDLNNNYNVAGNAINMAARVMGIADANQIIFTDEAYHQLIDMVDDPTMDEKFIEYDGVKIKHGIKISIYQYIDQAVEGLNVSPNEALALKQKMKNLMDQFGEMGFPMPSFLDETEEQGEGADKFVGMIEKFATVLQETKSHSDLISDLKNKK